MAYGPYHEDRRIARSHQVCSKAPLTLLRASSESNQIDLFSNLEQFLRKRDQQKLNDSEACHNVFRDQITKRIAEERFRVLFDEETGQPNAPIRLLVAMLILKEGFGWSDEALFEAIHFNLLVRRALGLENLTDEVPLESTYYLSKQRLYHYQVENGVNLLHEMFQELTGDQAKRLGVVGEKLSMDSTLLDSNLATCTRLQLIIACLQVFWKSLAGAQMGCLGKADREFLQRLCAKRPSQYIALWRRRANRPSWKTAESCCFACTTAIARRAARAMR